MEKVLKLKSQNCVSEKAQQVREPVQGLILPLYQEMLRNITRLLG